MSEDMGEKGERRTPPTGPENKSVPPELVEGGAPTLDEQVPVDRMAPSQVARTVAVAILTAAVVLGGLYLLWQLRTLISWVVVALFLAAVLNPPVNWLQRRHRLVSRSLAIILTFLGMVVVLIFLGAVFAPLVVQQLRELINFIVGVAQAGGLQAYLHDVADPAGLGWLVDRVGTQLSGLSSQLGELVKSVLLSTGTIAISAAGFVANLVSVLTLTFFMLLGSEGLVNQTVRLFPERRQPLVRGIIGQSGGAVFGYVSGNLVISVIAGVTTFILLLILGIPYASALALLVAVLDLIPLIGATLGAAVVIVVGFFVAPWTALVLLVFFLVYQQVEGSLLQPLVYSRAVHLDALTIFIAVVGGGILLGIPGALLAIPVAEIIRIAVTDVLAYRRGGLGEMEPEITDEPADRPPESEQPAT